MIEEDSREGFIHMQPCNFTKAGETGNGKVLEFIDMFDFIRIAKAAQDTVI